MAAHADDEAVLRVLNEQFIEAFRRGSWELLEPILSSSFGYLDGATGEVRSHERYVENLESNPAPALAIDQVVVHVDGDTAVVSARTSRLPGRYGRYVDTYARRAGRLGMRPRVRLAAHAATRRRRAPRCRRERAGCRRSSSGATASSGCPEARVV